MPLLLLILVGLLLFLFKGADDKECPACGSTIIIHNNDETWDCCADCGSLVL